MKIEAIAYGLLITYVVLLGVGIIFFFSGNTTMNQELELNRLILYILFIIVLLITLGSLDFSSVSIEWEKPAVASLVFAVVTFLIEKDLTTYAFMVVIASVLILASDSLPFPASRIAKAIGATVAGIMIMEIVAYFFEIVTYFFPSKPFGPLLLPNLLLYGAIIALSAGYVAELRFPKLYSYLSLGVLAVVGVVAIVIGGVLLRELPPLTVFDLFGDMVFIISIYSAVTLLTALGMLSIIHLARVVLARKMPQSKQPPKSTDEKEIEIQPYTPDETGAR